MCAKLSLSCAVAVALTIQSIRIRCYQIIWLESFFRPYNMSHEENAHPQISDISSYLEVPYNVLLSFSIRTFIRVFDAHRKTEKTSDCISYFCIFLKIFLLHVTFHCIIKIALPEPFNVVLLPTKRYSLQL